MNQNAANGRILLPSEQVKLFSATEWEGFVLEWVELLRSSYVLVNKLGGPGDKGRDVVAYYEKPTPTSKWDNYQCKHYDHPLAPSDVWVELGKLCVYAFRKDYPIPKKYVFVSPQGVGAKLHDLLAHPEKLKSEFVLNWKKACESKIEATTLKLDGALKGFVESFDFSIVEYIPINELIKQHEKSKYHYRRFRLEKPKRPKSISAPGTIAQEEMMYVKSLLDAYGDNLKATIASPSDKKLPDEMKRHFNRSREHFYEAETLNRFSRDQVDPDAFDDLKTEIYNGVIDTVDGVHNDGFSCVKAVTEKAQQINPSSNILCSYTTIADKHGICHHLSNEGKVTWIKKKL